MHRRFSALTLLLVLALGGAVLSGCGDQTGEGAQAPSTAPASSDESTREPACAQVWVDGEALPERYAGCSEEDGAWVDAAVQRCASGQVLVTYADRYYGAKGSRVNDMGESLSESAQYQRALRSCG